MAKEEYIIKIINIEFDKILKNINSISQNDNNGLSQQKIFLMKLYKNIELTKSNILLNIKNYFSSINLTNIKANQINQITKFLHSKKRNKSQNILKFKTKININKNNRNLFYSVINGSSTDLNNNNSYFSPSSNKKKNQIKPLIIDIKNLRTYKGKNANTTNSGTISCLNNLNTNNSNIIHNPYNINNIISSEEGEQDNKAIIPKKNSFFKKNFNCILNKSHSELKLRLKDKNNNYSSNKICHQKKKISLVDDIINNITLFNKDNKNKNKKNIKINTNTVNGEGKNDKNISFINKTKNGTQSFWKNNKKKLIINKINLQKLQLNTKTKTEIINKKKKMLKFSSNNFIKKKNNNNIKVTNNNSFKRNSNNLNKNISHSVNANLGNNNVNNNSLNYNVMDNNDDTINDKNAVLLANEIINFLDNLKNLQNSIIRKESDTKNMKINFEMQKVSLYQKAKNIVKNNINNNNLNDSKSNISNNSKGLNSTTVKSDSLSYIKNYFGNNIKNSFSGLIKNINNNDSIIKEFNLSNLKKTIEDIKISDENINEKLKNEIEILNNKLNEEINKGKKYEKIISDNLNEVINIHKILLNYSNNKNNLCCNVPSDKKFDWYIHEINEIIEQFGKEWNKINIEKNKNNNCNENIIKKQLYKATIDIINWLEPYMGLKNDDIQKYISKLEEEFNNYGIKQALNSLKSKIKELVYFLEINNINKNQNNKENNIINLNLKNIINKDNFIQLNSIILDIQNNLMLKIEKKNNEISLIKNDLQKALQLNNKIINLLSNYFPQETRVFQEKYDYVLSLYNAEQDKVNLLQNEYINIIEGLINYIDKGNKIYIELGKMWNIKPKKETNFELSEPDSSEMGHLSESDLLASESKKRNEGKLDTDEDKKEIEQYKKAFKYLENKISQYDNLLNNIVNTLIKIIKNMQMNQKQKELFFSLFRMLNIKDENIISLINNENKK